MLNAVFRDIAASKRQAVALPTSSFRPANWNESHISLFAKEKTNTLELQGDNAIAAISHVAEVPTVLYKRSADGTIGTAELFMTFGVEYIVAKVHRTDPFELLNSLIWEDPPIAIILESADNPKDYQYNVLELK